MAKKKGWLAPPFALLNEVKSTICRLQRSGYL